MKKIKIKPEWFNSVVTVFDGVKTKTIVLNEKTDVADIELLKSIKHPSITDDAE